MSGRAHRQDLRGLSTSVPKGGVKRAVVGDAAPDGGTVDYQSIYDKQHSAAKARGGKPVPGESGSEILDYQKPYEQDAKKRGR